MPNSYKFTDAQGRTRAGQIGETQWFAGIAQSVEWRGVLCEKGVLHAYSDSLLAVFRDPADGNYLGRPEALLWRCVGAGAFGTDGLKEGWEQITLIETMSIPAMSLEQRLEIGIRRSLDIHHEPSYRAWAEGWLSGQNKSRAAASATARAAEAAKEDTPWSAAWAAWAAGAASAWAVARAAETSATARAAAYAVQAAAEAAGAAEAAAPGTEHIPGRRLLEIIYQVMGEETDSA